MKSCGEQLNGLCMIVLNLVLNYAELKTAGTKFINSSSGPTENFPITGPGLSQQRLKSNSALMRV